MKTTIAVPLFVKGAAVLVIGGVGVNQPVGVVEFYNARITGPPPTKAEMPTAMADPTANAVGTALFISDPSSGATLPCTPANNTF